MYGCVLLMVSVIIRVITGEGQLILPWVNLKKLSKIFSRYYFSKASSFMVGNLWWFWLSIFSHLVIQVGVFFQNYSFFLYFVMFEMDPLE